MYCTAGVKSSITWYSHQIHGLIMYRFFFVGSHKHDIVCPGSTYLPHYTYTLSNPVLLRPSRLEVAYKPNKEFRDLYQIHGIL